jgi:hypothetical protein
MAAAQGEGSMSFLANMLGLGWIWHWLSSWWDIMLAYGQAGFAMAALVAIAILVPWIGFKARIGCLIAAAITLGHTIAFTVGIKKGADRVKADWDWTLGVEEKQGEQDRADAERFVRPELPDSVQLANDPWNRDRRKPVVVQGAESP